MASAYVRAHRRGIYHRGYEDAMNGARGDADGSAEIGSSSRIRSAAECRPGAGVYRTARLWGRDSGFVRPDRRVDVVHRSDAVGVRGVRLQAVVGESGCVRRREGDLCPVAAAFLPPHLEAGLVVA